MLVGVNLVLGIKRFLGARALVKWERALRMTRKNKTIDFR